MGLCSASMAGRSWPSSEDAALIGDGDRRLELRHDRYKKEVGFWPGLGTAAGAEHRSVVLDMFETVAQGTIGSQAANQQKETAWNEG